MNLPTPIKALLSIILIWHCLAGIPLSEGVYEQYFKKQLLTKGLMHNGMKNGHWSFYYPNQSLHFEGNFANDQKEGVWTYLNEKGLKTTEVCYKHGQLDSAAIYFNANGAKTAQEYYDNGQFTGYTEFFDAAGNVSATLQTAHFKTIFKTYHANGQLRFETINWLNKKNDTTLVFHANGQLKESLSFYKNILLAVGESFAADGTEWHNGDFENGKGSVIRYYDDGTRRSVANYEAGLKNGIAQFYHPNGQLKEAGMFSKGRKIGIWKHYDDKGELQEITEHRAETEDTEFHDEFAIDGLDLNKYAATPLFPGGERAFNRFAKENIDAFDYLKGHTATLLISLDSYGFVTQVKAVSEELDEKICAGIANSLDNLPRCIPAFEDGVPVASTLTQVIKF